MCNCCKALYHAVFGGIDKGIKTAEHLTFNQVVRGSNLRWLTKIRPHKSHDCAEYEVFCFAYKYCLQTVVNGDLVVKLVVKQIGD